MATDSSPLRPTKAVVEKAVRDILRPVVNELVILELFAGTGRVSEGLIEEGAEKSFAVDRRERPEELPEDVEWFRRGVDSFLNHGPPEPVGFVYLDPPYDTEHYGDYLKDIHSADWLEPHGLVGVETDRYTDLVGDFEIPEGLELKRNRRYGGTRLWIFQHEDDESSP